MKLTKFALFAWGTLIYNLGVIMWGAYVRATGSGAGCGRHWPTCNGQIIPRPEQIETLVEFSHRLTSGLAFILVLIMFIWARRAFAKGSLERLGAGWSMFFMVTETLAGASLVLFQLVAYDTSMARVVMVGIHLTNTLLLTGAITLTGWWASGGAAIQVRGQGAQRNVLFIALGLMIVLGITGAITALGDTLFPAESLAEGLRDDLDPSQHFLVRLRVWHPFLSMATGVYLLVVAGYFVNDQSTAMTKKLARSMFIVFFGQLMVGLINLVLLAPVTMQMIHLLVADLLWINLVLLTASVLAVNQLEANSVPVTQPAAP